MIIPKSIKIGWKTYAVKKVEKHARLTIDKGECYGEIEYDEQSIILNSAYDTLQTEATLVHEVLHGISEMYILDMSEDLVTKLANALYITLRDNPKLFREE